jgi:RimJ/RimL family protein N-acetyltransferase
MLPTLSDGDLALRPWRLDDAEDLRREVQDPETVRWMAIELPYTIEDAHRFITGTARAWAEREAAHFVIADSQDRLTGYLGVLSVEDAMRVIEIGYWVKASERGRGVATSALRLALEWVGEAIGPDRIELGMLAGNEASRAVAEKTGFEFDRSEPSGKELDGEPVDEWIFVLRS